jgi:hypothetical protein
MMPMEEGWKLLLDLQSCRCAPNPLWHAALAECFLPWNEWLGAWSASPLQQLLLRSKPL